ncbi:hypothetical protein SUGI_0135370 [Cryptomeria japonica]|uniref:uncharacterized protein LOC131035016 n=1 Tax=Cryptomeria japonica TaxID=3369 RepID=UPI002408E326|nr:uncharacterized protein LOC131035016 [Cryptomeria japonica]GLJ10797.1 hypothetical protein SUGI_0135370 [Cryptomeria japonica]
MAKCLRCALPNRISKGVSNVSVSNNHHSGLVVRWGRRSSTASPKTLSAKKYNFDQVKMFQNSPEGIVCYKNEDGEVICEGYDEGPCFRPLPGRQQEHHYRRDAKLYSILKGIRPYLVEMIDYKRMDQISTGICLQEQGQN